MNCSRCGFGIPEEKWDNDTDTATCPRCGSVHSRTQFDYRKRLHDFLLAKAGPQLEMSLWDNGERRLRTRLRPNPLRKWLVWIIMSVMLLGTFLFCRYSSSYAKPALLLASCPKIQPPPYTKRTDSRKQDLHRAAPKQRESLQISAQSLYKNSLLHHFKELVFVDNGYAIRSRFLVFRRA